MLSNDARACISAEHIVDLNLLITTKYGWLLSSSNLDFFTNSIGEKLPPSWQKTLTSIEPPGFAELLGGDKLFESTSKIIKYHTIWPLSLLALKAAAANYTLPRETLQTFSTQWQGICGVPKKIRTSNESTMDEHGYSSHQCKRARMEHKDVDKNYKNITRSEQSLALDSVDDRSKETEPHTTPCLAHPRLKQLFHKHVKPKKRHEISKLAQTVATTAARMRCKNVIDIGSGVGHLSRMLAYGYGLKVCCIEGQETLSVQASRLDVDLEETAAKRISKDEMSKLCRPVHINLSLESHSDPHDFIKGVKNAFGYDTEEVVFGIVGLHTCGDLGAMLLRTFSDISEIVFINLVGCCFMKLTTDLPPSVRGFPMSEFVSSRSRNSHRHLCYESRAVACHANESYCQQLLRGDYSDLKVHCYRAALEEIISLRWPHLRHANIASVKCTPDMSFSSYCSSALARLDVQVPAGDLISEKTLRNLAAWKQVINVISVRLMLAPVVETIVLLDRLLFVREKGISGIISNGVISKGVIRLNQATTEFEVPMGFALSGSNVSGHSGWLAPLFDPLLSPRNHVLVAEKK